MRWNAKRIFKQVWLNVGRVEEIPKAGDYLVKNIAAGEASVLVVRGKDGTIRAFHNMCSHRGNKVVWDGDGTCRGVFACKFHGWSYNTEGQLIFVPDEDQFFDLDKTAHGLTSVAADTWEGFIFINLAPQPKETLTEYLGELGERLHGFPFDRYTTRYTYQTESQERAGKWPRTRFKKAIMWRLSTPAPCRAMAPRKTRWCTYRG